MEPNSVSTKLLRIIYLTERPLSSKELEKMTGLTNKAIHGSLLYPLSKGLIKKEVNKKCACFWVPSNKRNDVLYKLNHPSKNENPVD